MTDEPEFRLRPDSFNNSLCIERNSDAKSNHEIRIAKKDNMYMDIFSEINFGEGTSNAISINSIDSAFPGSDPKPRLTIDSNGRVGIGTIDPEAPLHIPDGGLQIGTSPIPANNFYLVNEWDIDPNSRTFRLYHRGASTHLLTVASVGGHVGIGTKTPQNKLDVYGSAVIGTGYAGINPAPSNGLLIEGSVGIGTTSPGYKLEVIGNALLTGNYLYVNSESAGKLRVGAAWGMPGLYSGDDGAKDLTLGVPPGRKVYLGVSTGDAWIEGGTGNTYLKGNVGIGTVPPNDKLDVAGNLRILTGSNPIRFTSGWTGFPDGVTNQAEISNDTGSHKTLMIVGNSSAGLGRRVSVWDRLDVNGSTMISGKLGTNGYDPDSGYPAGWGGGIHTWDVYAEGTVGAGQNGNLNAYLNRDGNAYFSGNIGIGKSPASGIKLDVAGTINATSFVGDSTIARESRFDPINGHKHTGAAGEGPVISATDVNALPKTGGMITGNLTVNGNVTVGTFINNGSRTSLSSGEKTIDEYGEIFKESHWLMVDGIKGLGFVTSWRRGSSQKYRRIVICKAWKFEQDSQCD